MNALQQFPNSLSGWVRDFVIFCGRGALAGAGVGAFVFLRLGFPHKSQYMVGYISGLFVLSGVKLGISVWFVRNFIRALLRMWAQAFSCASRYQFHDMDLRNSSSDAPAKYPAVLR